MRFALAALAAVASAQQIGHNTQEAHLPLSWQECDGGQCFQEMGSVVLDANWRWLHNNGGYTNCYTGNSWDNSLCPNDEECAKNCALDGVDEATWHGTYGVETSGSAMKIGFVTQGQYAKNVGSRNYLMDGSQYKEFKMANKEFSFDVDVSNMPCGLNGALYFSQMPADGGLNEFSGNNAGSNYGTGYCDAQCPQDIKFINGEANSDGWHAGASDPNAGKGKYGSCCMEFDIWEANKMSQAFTAHPCDNAESLRCDSTSGTTCGANDDRYKGTCDKDGCDFATFRNGDHEFYGPGSNFQVDTTMPFTVTTQFVTADGTDNSPVTEIRRHYVQHGQKIETPSVNINGQEYNSISDEFCSAVKQDFGEVDQFSVKGGMNQMSKALSEGMVLVLSIWDDHDVDMLWLDSTYPVGSTKKGAQRGSCSTDSGKPDDVENNDPNSSVTFSNIKFGTIGSTNAEMTFTQ